MSEVNTKSISNLQTLDILCFDENEFDQFSCVVREEKNPAIVKLKAKNWGAVRKWTPEFFKKQYGKTNIFASLNLPENKIPYYSTEKKHRTKISLEAFIDDYFDKKSCYIDQSDISQFEGLQSDYSYKECLPSDAKFTSLWIGNNTRSGLHYDNMDNMFVQIYGTKEVYFVGPSDSGNIYPFGDSISKSKIDPEAPDLLKYPKLAKVKLYHASLNPGDVLYFPKGWWHHFISHEQSISLSCWYGDSLSIQAQIKYINAAGFHLWLPILRDFLWCGALKKPFKQRLFSTPPTGKVLFDLLFPVKKKDRI